MLDLQVDVSITTTTTVQALRIYHFYTCISFQNVMEFKITHVMHYIIVSYRVKSSLSPVVSHERHILLQRRL